MKETRKKKKKKSKNQPCNTEVREEGRRCSRCRSRDFPVSLGDTIVQQEFPHSPRKGPCKSRYLQTAAHGGPYTGPGGYAQKESAAWGRAHAGAGLSWSAANGEDPHQSRGEV